MLRPTAPRDGGEATAALDPPLDALLHLYMLNRGILMCPATSGSDVDAHTEALRQFATELTE